jgi:SAM-dependent methyltransferase
MHSDAAWKRWGELDPYFGVISQPKFRHATASENRAEFFASGEAEVLSILETANRLYGSFPRRTAVDFGCGVGRLAIPLSRRFDKVVAIDVAPAMIAEAKANCAEAGASRVTFFHAPREVVGKFDDVDFLISLIVLQHIPVRYGMALMGELLDGVAPNGVAALHVTTQRGYPWHKELVYLAKRHVPGARLAFNVIQGRRLSEPIMQANAYPLAEVLDVYRDKGMRDVVLRPIFRSPVGFVVYGRKRAPDGGTARISVRDDRMGAHTPRHGTPLP